MEVLWKQQHCAFLQDLNETVCDCYKVWVLVEQSAGRTQSKV